MKLKRFENISKSLVNLVLIVVMLLSVAAWRGQLFGHALQKETDENSSFNLELEDCQQFFPKAASVQKVNNSQFSIFDEVDGILGFAFAYKGEKGYGGRVPLYTFTDANNVICGITLGKHFEGNEYLNKTLGAGILTKWNGLLRSQVNEKFIDAVSGASFTSRAIILGVQNSASEQPVTPPFNFASTENISSLVLLFILTFACFFPKKVMKYRTVLQVLSIAVFGFWLSQLLSFVQIINWLAGGVNWQIHLVLLVLLTLAVVIPLVFGRAFYCSWVCPYGAAQELCGKACSRKVQIPSKTAKFLKLMRERIFIVLLILLWTGFSFDLTLIEPFTAFSVKTVSYWMLGFASIFLILSIFIPKVWCRYFCPTGFILEWIRK